MYATQEPQKVGEHPDALWNKEKALERLLAGERCHHHDDQHDEHDHEHDEHAHVAVD
jgi:hypothetical protein